MQYFVGWGHYDKYEGPYTFGSLRYIIPENPSENQRRLAVVTSTEGGTYDSVNMYDSCIVSVGLIQMCERFGYVSILLGCVAEKLGEEYINAVFEKPFALTKSSFQKNEKGKWAFFTSDLNGITKEVKIAEDRRKLFLGCSGKMGSWNDDAKARARTWLHSFASVWKDPIARQAQDEYLGPRMITLFVVPTSKEILFGDDDNAGWKGMIRAAFLSFAANSNSRADKMLQQHVKDTAHEKWSPQWCTELLSRMTFSHAIYPERYNKIRPVLEKLWDDIELPKTANDLRAWSSQAKNETIEEPADVQPETKEHEVQTADVPSTQVTDSVTQTNKTDAPIVVVRDQSVVTPSGFFAWVSWFFKFLFNLISKTKQ